MEGERRGRGEGERRERSSTLSLPCGGEQLQCGAQCLRWRGCGGSALGCFVSAQRADDSAFCGSGSLTLMQHSKKAFLRPSEEMQQWHCLIYTTEGNACPSYEKGTESISEGDGQISRPSGIFTTNSVSTRLHPHHKHSLSPRASHRASLTAPAHHRESLTTASRSPSLAIIDQVPDIQPRSSPHHCPFHNLQHDHMCSAF